MSYIYTNRTQVREAFWDNNPQCKRHKNWTQNQYPCDTRVAFVEYVDHLERSGYISERLASRVTL